MRRRCINVPVHVCVHVYTCMCVRIRVPACACVSTHWQMVIQLSSVILVLDLIWIVVGFVNPDPWSDVYAAYSFPNPSIAIVNHRHAFMRAHTYQWAHEYTCMHMCVHVRMLLSVLQL